LAILNDLHGKVAEWFEAILVEGDVGFVDATAAPEGS